MRPAAGIGCDSLRDEGPTSRLDSSEVDALSFEERLGLLVDREITERHSRQLTNRLRRARLKHDACIEDVLGTLDPLALLDEIRAVQHHLAALAAGATVHPMPERDADLDGFLRSLALAWRAGEVRPTHQARKRPPRHWRTRQDPFEAVWPRIVQWLEAEPQRTAKELFDRLRREQPGAFLPGQLRTLQRRVRDWRRLTARRLLFVDPTASPQTAFGSGVAVDEGNEAAPDVAAMDRTA